MSLQWAHTELLCDLNTNYSTMRQSHGGDSNKHHAECEQSTQWLNMCDEKRWRTAFLLVICPEVKERLWNAAVNGFYYSMWCLAKNLTDLKPGIQVLAHSNPKTTNKQKMESKKKHSIISLNSLKKSKLIFIKHHWIMNRTRNNFTYTARIENSLYVLPST